MSNEEVKSLSTENKNKEDHDVIRDVLTNKTEEKERFISDKKKKQFEECRAKLREKQELNKQIKETLKKEEKELELLKRYELQQRILTQAKDSLQQKIENPDKKTVTFQNQLENVQVIPVQAIQIPSNIQGSSIPIAEEKTKKKIISYIDSSDESDEEIIRRKKKIKKQKWNELEKQVSDLTEQNYYLRESLEGIKKHYEFQRAPVQRSHVDPYSFFTFKK